MVALASNRLSSPFKRWLLWGRPQEVEGPHEKEGRHAQHPWWRVMCLTGVDYFSTLGYQPGIAVLAAGALSPIATLVLVLVTLFGALPMYRWVAGESPHGDGSISMLERLLSWWQGKLFVLSLIGFVATGFVITITLSAADAAAHLAQNPFTRFLRGDEIAITVVLIGLLGAVFLKGFGEAIGVAVVLVVCYLSLNLVVIGSGFYQIALHPESFGRWSAALFASHGSPLGMLAAALLVFPKLALGLSGFETGVVVMPLIQGDPSDRPPVPAGRVRNGRKLLTTAAAIMSVLLITSSVVTTLLIPTSEFEEGGAASGRALAYLAHTTLGDGFGTIYDISTILILWFAGASAMAGLLNIVPRYLPRYGMAPEWARATRPLVLIFTGVCFLVTLAFRASVDAQAGAYATGVLAVMTSAVVAVTLSAKRQGRKWAVLAFAVIAAIFAYTTGNTVVERPEGLRIAALFIVAIVVTSALSRLWRVTELRATSVELDPLASRFVEDACRCETVRLIAHDTDRRDSREYAQKLQQQRCCSHMPADVPPLFLEVEVRDPSEFSGALQVRGEEVAGHRVLRAESSSVANAIAALLLDLRDRTGAVPHAYFSWSERGPLAQALRYVLFGEGDIAPVTHEVLRKAEPDPERRPIIHAS